MLLNLLQRSPGSTLGRRRQVAPLPSLETNLHKILARKIQDSEEVSFRKSKLLTMAYYKLLRESPKPLVDPKVQVSPCPEDFCTNIPVKLRELLTKCSAADLKTHTMPQCRNSWNLAGIFLDDSVATVCK